MLFGNLLSRTRVAAPLASPAPADDSAATPAKPLILLVDDSTMVRTMVGRTLVAHGFDVLACDSGEGGIREWEKRVADVKLVLSDVFMPGMDGLTFAKKLRGRSPRLPVILMSSKLDDDSRWIAEEAGFRLIAKPFKDELLIETINRMLRLTYG